MTFQTTVRIEQTTYLPGSIIRGAPIVVNPKVTLSTAATSNVFGRAFQQVAGAGNELFVTADDASTLTFAGILVNPKEHALTGTTAGTLQPSFELPNNTNASFLTTGEVAVFFVTTSAIGDDVFGSEIDGTLTAQAPGGGVPADHYGPIGKVIKENNGAINEIGAMRLGVQ